MPPVYPAVVPSGPATTLVTENVPNCWTTWLVIVTVAVAWSAMVTGCVLNVGVAQANEALSRPPVGVFSVTVQVRPAGIPAIVTGVAVVSVVNVPVEPVPQLYVPLNVLVGAPV